MRLSLEEREMTPEQKIAKAKELLFEASREIRAREKLARANDRCRCGYAEDALLAQV